MLNLRQQSVNVKRTELIVALQTGLQVHQKQYTEALVDYKEAITLFFELALKRAQDGDFSNVNHGLTQPVNRGEDYAKVIEMLEVSVDENITLDSEAFRAYYKNDWPWSRGFALESVAMKGAVASLSAAIGGQAR